MKGNLLYLKYKQKYSFGKLMELASLSSDQEVKNFIKSPSILSLPSLVSDPEIIKLAKSIVNNNELIKTLENHAIIKKDTKTLNKIRKTINSL